MRPLVVGLMLLAISGCSLLKSRYAMNDEVYAAKYAYGAEKTDFLGKAKQAFDARHVDGLGGMYLSGGAQYKTDAEKPFVGGELGIEGYPTSWTSARASLATYLGDDEGYLGLDTGFRLQTPTRIAPFVGLGMFHGASRTVELADWDGLDNDNDGLTDERGEEKSGVDGWLSAVYPEVGTHLWVNGNWRLTAYGRYFVTTEGRSRDDWLVGLQLAAFGR
ncbi:MAG: hypothetical protein H6823_09250 [Planctomycetaceae bacterium]|nr:hypothetical protein [Planctomycetaceae bacterium]